jgi:hypothetical protein
MAVLDAADDDLDAWVALGDLDDVALGQEGAHTLVGPPYLAVFKDELQQNER